MAVDMDSESFKVLLALEKIPDEESIHPPILGEQNKHSISGLYDQSKKFTAIINRKGHIQVNDLTLIMQSRSSGIMYRYDVIGVSHNGTLTPHLHIFDSNHNGGSDVVSGAGLDSLGLPSKHLETCTAEAIIQSLSAFLIFNNVTLESVVINGTTL